MFVKTVMIAQTNSSYWSISSQLTRSTNTPSNLRYITWVFMQFFQVAKDYIQDMFLLSLVFFLTVQLFQSMWQLCMSTWHGA